MKLKHNQFQEFEFETENEAKAAHLLPEGTLCLIRNQLATATLGRVALDYDPLNPVKFAQDEAFLKGQISMCQFLIDGHNSLINDLDTGE